MERIAPCPVCRKPAEPRSRNPSFPFCSDRCRRIDLGRWFVEEYRVPDCPADGDERPAGSDDGSDR